MSEAVKCPMMGVSLRDIGDGYHPTVRWHPKTCLREGCGVWTRYGCGLSHNVTVHVPDDRASGTMPRANEEG
jgi:hypothetical protein